MKKRGVYPCGAPRVPGITYRADRAKWRVRLYRGTRVVIHDSIHTTLAAAIDNLEAARIGQVSLERMLAADDDGA